MGAGGETVLLLGDFRYTLTFIRSLSRAGYRVVVAGSGFPRYARYSRHTAAIWELPRIVGGGQEFAGALARLLAGHPEIRAIVPLGDRELAALARHAGVVPSGVRLVMPAPEVVLTCGDKLAMCEIAGELGIPQEPYATAVDLPELSRCAAEVGYPCIVKPTDQLRRLFEHKALICGSPGELRRALPEWPAGVERILVQRYAAGGRYNVQLLAVEGRLVRRVQTLTLRTDRLDGTGYTVDAVTVTLPALVDEYCRRLMERLRYDGPGCAQFMIDRRTGRMSFLELNPRLGAAFAVAALCAVDFPRLAVQAALEPGAVDSFGPDYAPGKRIAWTYGDLDGIIRALDAGEIGVRGALRWLGQAAASFVTADIHTTWSWRDPAPTLVAYLQLLAGVGRRVVRR